MDDIIRSINGQLHAEAIPVGLRPLRVVAKLSEILNCRIELDDPIAHRVNDWYEARYGRQARSPQLMGRIPIFLNEEVFVVHLFPSWKKSDGHYRHTYDWTFEAGDALFDEIHDSLHQELRDVLDTAFLWFSELNGFLAERVLPQNATNDIDAAIDELVRPEGPRLGLSKWASQQVVEKCMKAYLNFHSATVPWTHDLMDLNRRCVSLGAYDFSAQEWKGKHLIEHVQCSPGARYSETSITTNEAVDAVGWAIMIAGVIAAQMRLARGGRRWLDLPADQAALFVTSRLASAADVEVRVVD